MLRCRVIALTTFGQDWRIQGGSVNNLVAQARTQNLASEMLTFSSDRRKNILMPCSVQVDPQDDQVIITRCKERTDASCHARLVLVRPPVTTKLMVKS